MENQPELDDVPNELLQRLIFDYSKRFLNNVADFECFRKYEMTNDGMLACPLSHQIMHQPVVVSSGESSGKVNCLFYTFTFIYSFIHLFEDYLA